MAGLHEKRPGKLRTICEVHREIYRGLKSIDPNHPLLENVEEAFNMGKKLSNKLRQYKYNYDDDWWEKNKYYSDVNLKK